MNGRLGTNPEVVRHEACKVVTLTPGVAQSDILLSVGDGRTIEIVDVTFTSLVNGMVQSGGTAIVTVGILNSAVSGTPTRKVEFKVVQGTTVDADLVAGTQYRLSREGTITGTDGVVYSATWPSTSPLRTVPRGALVASPSVVTYEYTQSSGADETGAVEVRVFWRYADNGRRD